MKSSQFVCCVSEEKCYSSVVTSLKVHFSYVHQSKERGSLDMILSAKISR